MSERKKPAKVIPVMRHAKVTIWDNGENGFAIQIEPPSYKDDTGTYKPTSFWPSDLHALKHAIELATKWLDKKAGNEE